MARVPAETPLGASALCRDVSATVAYASDASTADEIGLGRRHSSFRSGNRNALAARHRARSRGLLPWRWHVRSPTRLPLLNPEHPLGSKPSTPQFQALPLPGSIDALQPPTTNRRPATVPDPAERDGAIGSAEQLNSAGRVPFVQFHAAEPESSDTGNSVPRETREQDTPIALSCIVCSDPRIAWGQRPRPEFLPDFIDMLGCRRDESWTCRCPDMRRRRGNGITLDGWSSLSNCLCHAAVSLIGPYGILCASKVQQEQVALDCVGEEIGVPITTQ